MITAAKIQKIYETNGYLWIFFWLLARLFVTLPANIEAVTKIPQEWNKFYLKDVSFVNLITRRIFNVLIVANPYDAFMLEDDGRVDDKIFD